MGGDFNHITYWHSSVHLMRGEGGRGLWMTPPPPFILFLGGRPPTPNKEEKTSRACA